MAATISFLTAGYNLNTSGLGFFGAGGFGQSVAVSAYQDTTYITDGAGLVQGPQGNNCKWIHSASGQLAGSVNLALQSIPNYQSTMNIHFVNDTPCRVQNGKFYIYDRTSTSNQSSGVLTYCCNIIHPLTTQTAGGSGGSTWQAPNGSSYMILTEYSNGGGYSPGLSGYGFNGISTSDASHDFYMVMSASPNSIGAKSLYGCLVSLEYL